MYKTYIVVLLFRKYLISNYQYRKHSIYIYNNISRKFLHVSNKNYVSFSVQLFSFENSRRVRLCKLLGIKTMSSVFSCSDRKYVGGKREKDRRVESAFETRG